MNCSEVRDILQLYQDNELDADLTLRLQRHLEPCPACMNLLNDFMQLDVSFRESARAFSLQTEPLRLRIIDAIRPQSSRESLWRHFPAWMQVAAVVILALATAVAIFQRGGFFSDSESLFAAIASDHAAHCAENVTSGTLVDGREIQKPLALYAKSQRLPDLSSYGYTRPRARICIVKDQEFLHVVFYHNVTPPLSVFMRLHPTAAQRLQSTMIHQDQYTLNSFTKAGVDVLVVSALDEEKTAAIAQSISTQL